MTGSSPPKVFLEIDNQNYETTLGTYCWNNGCVDTIGPVELLEGKEPIVVMPGETIRIGMNYNPKPSVVSLQQFKDIQQTDIEIKNNQITAPLEKGVYYYSYGVWWLDQKTNVSHGDAFYAFAIEIK
ncbi:hypothetical protein H1D32_02180 [Anaerobacillus sp. CMMVII]|nr:hypothetical protein [Anaerobacillus sp. CMMVII]